MIAEEKLIAKINNLPPKEIDEVISLVDSLLHRNARRNGATKLTPQQRASSIVSWAESHSYDTPVIIDDRREVIYED